MKKISSLAVIGFALVLALGVGSGIVLAYEGEDETTNTTTIAEDENKEDSGDDKSDGLKERLQEFKEKRQANRQNRLAANKLRVCEQRKTRITNIMNRAVTRAERQLNLFSTIAERVKTFYTEKGRVVANYAELVAAVDAAKAKAEADIAALKDLEPFACDSDDPKGQAEAFKLALTTVRKDLKDYRTAVKNLIVGVKSANSAATGDSEEGGTE
jgi:hypothetical protein